MSKTGLILNCDVSITSANSSEAQLQRFLERIKCGPVTLMEARKLGITHPTVHVSKLRKQGNDIRTERITERGPAGVLHRGVAKYSLRQADEVDK